MIIFSTVTSPIIRPPMALVESGFNSEQVSLMRPIYIEGMYGEVPLLRSLKIKTFLAIKTICFSTKMHFSLMRPVYY